MTLSNKSRIAINAMLDVAVHGAHEPVALAAISERQNISLSYLEQLFRQLRTRGFVKSWRGPGGGYQLNKRSSAISMADIVTAVAQQPPLAQARAGKRHDCGAAEELWAKLDRHLLAYLRTVTLEAVMQEAGLGKRPPTSPQQAAATDVNRREAPQLRAA